MLLLASLRFFCMQSCAEKSSALLAQLLVGQTCASTSKPSTEKTVQEQRAGGWVFVADLPPFAQNKTVQASTARDGWCSLLVTVGRDSLKKDLNLN